MLKGFMVPRSPQGHASIDPPPPWHTRATLSQLSSGPIRQ